MRNIRLFVEFASVVMPGAVLLLLLERVLKAEYLVYLGQV